MSNFKADVPLINLPLVGADGKVNETWFMFFIQLFRRTGGTMGSSPGDLSLNDIDLDADSLDADLSGLRAMFAESGIELQTKVDESAPQKLISAVNDLSLMSGATVDDYGPGQLVRTVNDINTALQIYADDVADKAQRVDLAARSTEIALILEEAQDVLAKLRRALQDTIIDQITPLDIVQPASAAPLVDGTAAVGTSLRYARQDHVHPTDTSREPSIAAGTTAQYWRGDKSWQTLDKTAVGLSNVENTALSTWAGSSNITTVGSITSGTWKGTSISQTSGSVANGSTLVLNLGNRFVGFIVVSSVNSSNAAVRQQTTYSAFVFDGDATSIQQIHTANGSGGGSSFTLAFTSGTGFVVTNNAGATRTLVIAAFGSTQS